MWRFDRRQPPASPYIKPDHPGPDTGAGAGASTGAGARGPAASTGGTSFKDIQTARQL